MKKKKEVPLHIILRKSAPLTGKGDGPSWGSQDFYRRELFERVEDGVLNAFRGGKPQSFVISDGKHGRYRVTIERVSQKGAGK